MPTVPARGKGTACGNTEKAYSKHFDAEEIYMEHFDMKETYARHFDTDKKYVRHFNTDKTYTQHFDADETYAKYFDIEAIYTRHFNMVYRICYSYLKNPADTEDATADVFVKLMRRGIVFGDAEYEKAWLIRTAINTSKDCLKHWWRNRANINEYEHIQGDQGDSSLEIDETLKAVMELPARYKDVIYLHYYEGYTSGDIAKILKKPYSTIRNHMREARKLLRGVLENEG
ncbi:MAG: RNA polymerase sigma factor [Oscillospiraceae bacterium]|nr:RNA polymerase sigma factor [Oscillospiraceae bacterium]